METKVKEMEDWADALEREAVEEARKTGQTVADIRELHSDKVRAMFERQMEANRKAPHVVQEIRKQMEAILERVEVLADEREEEVIPFADAADQKKEDLVVGKLPYFKRAA